VTVWNGSVVVTQASDGWVCVVQSQPQSCGTFICPLQRLLRHSAR